MLLADWNISLHPMMVRAKFLIPVLTGLLVSGCQTVGHHGLSAFRSDGCSCFPDGTLKQPDLWKRHCIEHDYAYWKGGTRQERKAADLKLRNGIHGEGKPVIAQIVYAGVRIGGVPWLPTPWRWGFGWSFPRGYRELDEEEKREMGKMGKMGHGSESWKAETRELGIEE